MVYILAVIFAISGSSDSDHMIAFAEFNTEQACKNAQAFVQMEGTVSRCLPKGILVKDASNG